MSVSKEQFIREALKEIKNKNISVFAGAGLSRSSGYVNWKELLRAVATDLNLDIDQEHDLVTIAQYFKNKYGRQGITQSILEEFSREAETNENLDILSRLPIDTFWTTNYDSLIEDTLKRNGKKVDVKRSQSNLKNFLPNRDAVVYKMHGDITSPDQAVIIRDDYEQYNETRQLFTINLQGELVSKTFVFIGFSFEDPNLEQILSRIRIILSEQGGRNHYCFLKRVSQNEFGTIEEFQYADIKQQLRIEDLKRYNIRTVLVNEYEEITQILKKIEEKHKLNKIFISGSTCEYGVFGEENAIKLMHHLPKELIKKDNQIISGFGLGVGSYVINGALDEIYNSKYKHIDDYLVLRPFPQFQSGERSLRELWESYRIDMISEVGISIFIFGNKLKDDQVVIANGVWEEFQIAKQYNNYIIPIGSTGYAAQKILCEIKGNIDDYMYLRDSIYVLENSIDPNDIINEVGIIIDRVRRG